MSSKPSGIKKTSRRTFAKSVALSLIAAPLASTLVQAQTATPTPTPVPTPSPAAQGYFELAKARFGGFMTPEQLERLKTNAARIASRSEGLSRQKLQNGDEPDFVFSA